MKQSLQLKLSQSLTMTPQLQQAIKLLQLSTLDLQQEIQSILEANPMLEFAEEGEATDEGTAPNDAEPGETSNPDSEAQQPNGEDYIDQAPSASAADAASSDGDPELNDWQQEGVIPDDSPVDTRWEDDVYMPPATHSGSSDQRFNEMPDLENREGHSESLSDHLLWQLNLTPMSDKDRHIAITIIDALLPSGLLSIPPEELLESFDPGLEIELDEIEAVRHRLQQFDPMGVASVDLRDCLMVQLAQYPADMPWHEQAAKLISRHLPLLATRDFAQLLRRMQLREADLKKVIELIRSLNPRPGEAYEENTAEYIVPDVYVKKEKGKWVVELNPDIAPRIRINNQYAALIKRADNGTDNTFLKDNLQEARWFLKSLLSRNETLLKVASKIVEHQKGFLEAGEEMMKPLILADIASDVEMHESTISRVTTRKYMHTPRGIFELKYFFSSHLQTAEGGECSSTAIRAMIKKLVSNENSRKPLSDNKIAQLLDDMGIKVARRTIAKYREALSIPPSNERKHLA
ncbi:MAG: RNA polymerase factor sigma-54 [Gammaproteobacteria bacterium]|nr:RNA polymerase factor sigma-54 [Gammaproteobacteria bacterium]MBT8149838.1 RNA polymerase factor sigma-54 [Gammaproteobacteria bacterium]NNM12554.1 RNA polymerase factor sigma-54 [Pseudomonadales bacterium]RZV56463.1 MAG: RNA polymerase factor sigma-54 [Pseudomonadales bacterium]